MAIESIESVHTDLLNASSTGFIAPENDATWSMEAKIGLAGLALAVAVPLTGFMCRKWFWPFMATVMKKDSTRRNCGASEPLPSGPSQSPIQSRGLRPGQQGRYRHRRHVRRNILPFFELDLDLEDLPSSLPSSRTTGVWRSVTTIEDNMECTDMDTLETHP
ncbi:uncharacterized protein J3D65DRAFT_641312 [Phyllosticta citribraziliensis]|uniref:Uncharacterized protein n=1 Tax=Phyllosticta citribraziliensis TaxID=989973 RepID=A0ABR1L818_9PEZI